METKIKLNSVLMIMVFNIKKINKEIILSVVLLLANCGCMPYENVEPDAGRRGLGYRNCSSLPIKVIHISKLPSGILKDSSVYELNIGEEKVYYQQTDEDANLTWEHTMHRKYDTVKVLHADTIVKRWKGPIVNDKSLIRTPYDIECWERIERKDTTILRFTITDKDFE